MTNNTYFLANLHARPDVLRNAGELTMLGNEKDYLATRVSYKLEPPRSEHQRRDRVLHVAGGRLSGGPGASRPTNATWRWRAASRSAFRSSAAICTRMGSSHPPTATVGRSMSVQPGPSSRNGLGIVVLKRLDEALDDGDTIYAVIKGAAVNNDGSGRVSFTAPSVNGQADAVAHGAGAGGHRPGDDLLR